MGSLTWAVPWGARCREAREKGEREREWAVLPGARCREAREGGEWKTEREKKLHSPLAPHAHIQWAT